MEAYDITNLLKELKEDPHIFICGPSYGNTKNLLKPNCAYMPTGACCANCRQRKEQPFRFAMKTILKMNLPCETVSMDFKAKKRQRSSCGITGTSW